MEVKLSQRKKSFSRIPFFLAAGLFLAGLVFWILKFYPDNLLHLIGFFILFFLFSLFLWLGVLKKLLRSFILSLFLLLFLIFRVLEVDTPVSILFLAGFLFIVWRLLEGKT